MKPIEEFTNQIINGDSLQVLKDMPDESVNLTITSPPYFGCRVYGDETVGREKDPREYIDHIVEFTKEIKRVLRSDGSFYLNIGDVYFGTKGFGRVKGQYMRKTHEHYKQHEIVEEDGKYLQHKQLLFIPPRIAIKMQDDGWILRNSIIWEKCLEENTRLFIRKDGKYKIVRIGDLHDNYSNTFVPTQDSNGRTKWVMIKNVFDVGIKNGLKITTRKGNEIIATKEHRFPCRTGSGTLNGKYRKLKLKCANELNLKDKLYLNYKTQIDLPLGSDQDYLDGFFIGFFVAEGNYIFKNYKPYKDNQLSLYSQKHCGRTPRGIRKVGIQLSCGKKDIERKYIDNLLKISRLNIYQYGNNVRIRSYSKKLLNFINEYVEGTIAKDKNFSTAIYNKSMNFLKGILNGFLAGDGHYEVVNRRWAIGITPNLNLKNDLQMICRTLGYEFRYEGIRLTGNGYNAMYFKIRTERSYKRTSFNCTHDSIDKITKINNCHFYDLEIDNIYHGIGSNQHKITNEPTSNLKLSQYNNLYFLMNGIWTHNSNACPNYSEDRRLPVYEYIFHFVKSKDYYFDFETAKKHDHHRDVINCNIESFGEHQATFPEKLIYPFILTTSKENDIVLDPFGGHGTVGLVCQRNNRKYILIELNNKYCDSTKLRLKNAKGLWGED